MNKKEIADIYIRLSSKNQEDGMSKETQEEKCRDYCKKHKLTVRNVYYENCSAITPNIRPVFNKIILNQQTPNKADYLVTYCVNRFTRNHIDFYQAEIIIDKFGTKIAFVKENQVVQKPMKSYETFLMDIIIAHSKFEVKQMNEIRKNGLIARAKTGLRPSKLNYGYKIFRKNPVIVPSRAAFVRRAFELYATDQYSLATLPEALYDEGLRYQLQKNGKIPKASLENMLKSIFYTGKFYYPGCEGLIEGKHKPIIDIELFSKVQMLLSKAGNGKINNHNFLYSMLINFKETGKFLVGDIKKSKYIYYTTVDENKKYFCINENLITDYLMSRLGLIKLNLIPDNLIKKVFKEKMNAHIQEIKNLKRSFSRRYHSELELKNFVNQNKIDDSDFIKEESKNIEEKYPDVRDTIDILQQRLLNYETKYKNALENDLATIYNTLDFNNKRKLLELVKNKFEISSDKKIKITFKPAFRKLVKR